MGCKLVERTTLGFGLGWRQRRRNFRRLPVRRRRRSHFLPVLRKHRIITRFFVLYQLLQRSAPSVLISSSNSSWFYFSILQICSLNFDLPTFIIYLCLTTRWCQGNWWAAFIIFIQTDLALIFCLLFYILFRLFVSEILGYY